MGTIRVSNIGKAYRRYPDRWARLLEWTLPWCGRRHQLQWVLRNLNFQVNQGEAVGIIGLNGAGKSTLLKIITGTTLPTTGSVTLQGRVAAMLELGMGFHPDFTGRQNVFMAAQLLGISSQQTHQLMPEIEAFAEIGDYIDQQVRVYSSGMQVRLAFSVATAVRPDILIIDEALSVGDAYFQHKSFERIRRFRDSGTTLLLVSHDKLAIQSICDRALLLDAGQLIREGTPESVMDYYNALLAEAEKDTVHQESGAPGQRARTSSGSGKATITAAILTDDEDRPLEVVRVGQPVCLRIQTAVHDNLPRLVMGYQIRDRLGQPVFGTNTSYLGTTLENIHAGETPEFRIRFAAAVGPGSYSVTVALHGDETHVSANYQWLDLALVFTVVNPDLPYFVGTAWLPPEVECHR